jgi:hypothetical protein
MAALGDLLFYRRDQVGLDDVLRRQVELLPGNVDALPDKLFSEKSDQDIAQYLAKEHAVEPLSVDFAAAKPNVQETQVEVHDQFGFNRGPIRAPGLLATKSIPFKGDPALWRLRTNPFNMNPQRVTSSAQLGRFPNICSGKRRRLRNTTRRSPRRQCSGLERAASVSDPHLIC